jgi:hypothetical protein
VALIELDLGRTFPALDFFRKSGPYHESLRNVLETYVMYRPDVGYVCAPPPPGWGSHSCSWLATDLACDRWSRTIGC